MALAPNGPQPGSPALLYEHCDIPEGMTMHEYRHGRRRPHSRRYAARVRIVRLVRGAGLSRR
jgi:hypothetical protein